MVTPSQAAELWVVILSQRLFAEVLRSMRHLSWWSSHWQSSCSHIFTPTFPNDDTHHSPRTETAKEGEFCFLPVLACSWNGSSCSGHAVTLELHRLSDNVESVGDVKTRTKELGAKERERRSVMCGSP